jgi:hypothetical protein
VAGCPVLVLQEREMWQNMPYAQPRSEEDFSPYLPDEALEDAGVAW